MNNKDTFIEGVTLVENFISNDAELFEYLKHKVQWNEQMKSRKTASFGQAYNYSQIHYPFQPLLPDLEILVHAVSSEVNFTPNNCLINYYIDGKSKMGFHSDQTDILVAGTGVVIVSLGEPRILRFRKIADHDDKKDFLLTSGSLLYMTAEVQDIWQHAIPKAQTDNPRMSITLREMK